MITPNRKKLIRKKSSTSISTNARRNQLGKMGRPENKDEENIFMEKLKSCAPGINLELEVQILTWLRFFRARGAHESPEGLAELYLESGCEDVYRSLLHADYLSL